MAFLGPGRSAEEGEVASWGVPREVAQWCAVQGVSGHGQLGRMKPVGEDIAWPCSKVKATAQPLSRTSLRNIFHGSSEVNLSRNELQ